MLRDYTRLVTAHVDYYRASWEGQELNEDTLADIEAGRREALAALGKRTERARPAALYGYYGGIQEGIFVGTREGGVLLQASGVAGDFICQRCANSTNVPRIDIAVTVWTDASPTVHIDRAERVFVSFRNANGGRPAKPRRVSTFGYGDTMYSGQRGSKNYILRVYDKGAASKEEVYEGAVRYEVELANENARFAYESLREAGFGHYACLEVARGYFRERGLVLPVSRETLTMPVYKLPSTKGGLQRRIEWLDRSVKPSLDLLRENGYSEAEIAEIVGIRL